MCPSERTGGLTSERLGQRGLREMKVRLKIDPQWLELERQSMDKLRRDYERWAAEVLRKAKEAGDLRTLRKVVYELGDRWEWSQATGDWLSSGEPLEAVGLVLRMPGLEPGKERYVVYAIMAYSKGATDQFDHLGDKERVIIEHDTETGEFVCWSTTGHGCMDLRPTRLQGFSSLDEILSSVYFIAQPGDHALRLEVPRTEGRPWIFVQALWQIATGSRGFTLKAIDLLRAEDIEEHLDFHFAPYPAAVIALERKWEELRTSLLGRVREGIVDEIPDDVQARDERTLQLVGALLHRIWNSPPATQVVPIRRVLDELSSARPATEVQAALVPLLEDLLRALNDVLERAEYLKWKSVIDERRFEQSDIFRGLSISRLAKDALAVAFDDILREHTLAYIGYPERTTAVGRAMRVLFGVAVLPARLIVTFLERARLTLSRLASRFSRKSTGNGEQDADDTGAGAAGAQDTGDNDNGTATHPDGS